MATRQKLKNTITRLGIELLGDKRKYTNDNLRAIIDRDLLTQLPYANYQYPVELGIDNNVITYNTEPTNDQNLFMNLLQKYLNSIGALRMNNKQQPIVTRAVHLYVKFKTDGYVWRTYYDVPIGSLYRYYWDNRINHDYMIGSNEFVYSDNKSTWEFALGVLVDADYQPSQRFADNESFNCLLKPIKEAFLNKIAELNEIINQLPNAMTRKELIAKRSKTTRLNKRIQEVEKLIIKTDAFMLEFPDGVPEDRVEYISNTLKVSIYIYDILKQKVISYRINSPKVAIRYINARFDHLEVLFNISKELIVVTREEYNKKLDEEVKAKRYHIYSGSVLYTLENNYIVKDFDYEEFEKENENNPLMGKINLYESSRISEFVDESCHFSGTILFTTEENLSNGTIDEELEQETLTEEEYDEMHKDDIKGLLDEMDMLKDKTMGEIREQWRAKQPTTIEMKEESIEDLLKRKNIKHIDHIKSYANYKACSYFDKYKFIIAPTVLMKLPNDFDYKKYGGFYYIKSVNDNLVDINIRRINRKMHIYTGDNIYSSPELEFIYDLGYRFDIDSGCISVEQPMDFDFDLIEIKHYAQWTGIQASMNERKQFYVYGNKETATLIKNQNPELTVHFVEGSNYISINSKKTESYHRAHLASYILAYSRIQILTQLYKIKFENIVKVQLDGIYYIDSEFKLLETFREKDFKSGDSFFVGCSDYFPKFDKPSHIISEYDNNFLHNKILAIGAGGTGKTHFYLKNEIISDVLYIAPTNLLCRAKSEEFGCESATIHKLLGIQCREYNLKKRIILIDEASMLTTGFIDKLIDYQKEKKITMILAGDIGYQIPPYVDDDYSPANIFKMLNSFRTVKFTKSYRSQDDKLNKLLRFVRRQIDNKIPTNLAVARVIAKYYEIKTGNTENLYGKINQYILAKIDFVNDLVVSSTHNRCDLLDGYRQHINMLNEELGLNIQKKKWVANRTTDHHCKGDIATTNNALEEAELLSQGSYTEKYIHTVHVCQGLTCELGTKIFIDIVRLFSINILYTALSRVRNLDQIVLFN